MKKIIAILVVLVGFTASVYAQSKKATVVITDTAMSDAVTVINILCNSTLDINEFSNPDKKVSLNFNDVECTDIITIMKNYGYGN